MDPTHAPPRPHRARRHDGARSWTAARPRATRTRADAVHRADADMTPPPFPPARARVCPRDSPRSLVSESDVADNIDNVRTKLGRSQLTAPPSTRSFAAMFAVSPRLRARPSRGPRALPRRAPRFAAAWTVDAPIGDPSPSPVAMPCWARPPRRSASSPTPRGEGPGRRCHRPSLHPPRQGGGTVALADVVKANKYTVLYFYNRFFLGLFHRG